MAPSPSHFELEELLAQRPRLKALARRLLADEHGAEDVVQDAWIAALERPPRDTRALGGWLQEVVRTLALRRKRGERRHREREEHVARPEGQSVADRLRTQREVVDAVLALDEALRETVHARYFEDLPPREIARLQGVSIDTVNDRLKRARRKLRADLERRLGEGGATVWSLALLPHAALSPRAATLLEAQLAGGSAAGGTSLLGELLLMKKALATALVILLAAAGIWWSRVDGMPSREAELALDRPHEELETTPESATVAAVPAPRAPVVERASVPSAETRDWIIRGRVFLGSRTPAPGVSVRCKLWSGYDTDLTALIVETFTSDAEGRFEWRLPTPEETVTVNCSPVVDDAVTLEDSAVIAIEMGPPQELELHVYPWDVVVSGTVFDEGGERIQGAVVSASTEFTTGADGRYTVRASSHRTQEYVGARAAGHALKRASVEMPAAGGEVECDFSLRSSFVISGRVVDENALPVEGAELSTFYGGRIRVLSNVHGEFVLDHLDPSHDEQSVMIQAEGFVDLNESVPTSSAEPVERVFVLERGARVAGRVVDGRGDGIAAATLCLGFSVNAWNAQWEQSADDGRFEFATSPRGEQSIWIEREGYAAIKTDFEVPEVGDLSGELTIVLDGGRRLAGRVRDAQGAGVAGVRVTPLHEGDLLRHSAKTDAEGSFTLEHAPDAKLELSFYRKGWDRVVRELGRGDLTDIQVEMNPSGRVAGRVIDALTGEAVESFRIRLERVVQEGAPRISLWSTWVREGRAFSDATGRWETSDLELPIGWDLAVEVRAEGYATSELVRTTIAAEPDHEELVIALVRGRHVTGRVVDASTGAPVEGARVSYMPCLKAGTQWMRAASMGDPWASYFTRTDAAGEFAFEHVAPGKVNFEVEHQDYDQNSHSGRHEIRMSGPDPVILIELGGAGRITGVALDAGGSARAGVELTLIDVEVPGLAGEIRRRATTDHEGRFAFRGLRQGYYRLGEELPLLQGTIGIGRGIGVALRGALDAEVVLQPTGSASIEAALLFDGDPPERVELTLMILPEEMGSPPFTHTHFSVLAFGGSFELDELPAGKYTIMSRWFEDGRSVNAHPVELVLVAGEELRPTLNLIRR